jgi:DNA gyrase subunit A
MSVVEQVPLHRATADRYLSYALSVITSRALPDVRDGLKPVQRRILYAMAVDMGLSPTGRYRKCATVVGDVMGRYHPHGDASIYDTLVRLAQDFSMRAPLIDGQGNFGSLDGDPPASYRYTECRLRPLGEELARDIRKRVVDFRPTYDGQRAEPIVLPAPLPHLLVNGSEGIAVGMATRIPPHNVSEVVEATIALLENRDLTVRDLLQHLKGPDFPTAGELLADVEELVQVYETGHGSLKLRSTWREEKDGRRRLLIIDSVPYGQNKAKIVENIGEDVRTRRLPQVTDVRDESTDVVRVVLELKSDANAQAVMAWLFKHTDLQVSWPVNLTALVPVGRVGTDEDEAAADLATPQRLDLKAILGHWLDFRLVTVRRRFEFDLAELKARVEVLEGYEKIFDALDEVIALIRASDGRQDAAEKLTARFDLTEVQTEAILEIRLYRLAKLEIEAIRKELEEKRAEGERLDKLIQSDAALWTVIRKELRAVNKFYGSPRLTRIGGAALPLTFDEDLFIVDEETYVVVTRDGWIKRQSSFSGLSKIRVRDGDEIGWLIQTSTRCTLTFLTNLGAAYVLRAEAVPATTGYGDPVQAQFSFEAGERVIGVLSHDPQHRAPTPDDWPADCEDPAPPYALAITQSGRGMRFALDPHSEPSNKSGRRYARLDDGDQVFAALPLAGPGARIGLASRKSRVMVTLADGLPVLKAAGKGVQAIKLDDDDQIVACEVSDDALGGPAVVTSTGRELVVSERAYGRSERASRGHLVLKRGAIHQWKRGPVQLVVRPPRAERANGVQNDVTPTSAPGRSPGSTED